MSFWNFLNFAQTSKINSKLSEPGVTLEDLLADDSIITEFKSLNPKLLDFCSDHRVKQMLSYIIEEPPQDADRDRGYKYPFVSCEVLTADVETLLEAFFGRNPNNLKRDSNVSELSREGDHSDVSGDRSHESEEHSGEEEKPSEDNEEKTEKEETEAQESPKKEDENKEETTEEKKEEKEEKTEESPEKAPKDESAEQQEKSQEQEQPEETIEKLQPDELPNYFFSFLDGETLNETLVGYFARFLNHLILRKENDIYKYVWEHPEVIDKLIAHVDMRGLAECLSKLFLLEPSHQSDEFNTVKSEKLKQLAQVLNKEEASLDSDALNQTALIFNEILTKKSTLHNKHFIESYIYSKDFLNTLFNNLGRHPTLSTHVASIINTLLTTHLQKDDDHNVSHDSDEPKKDDTKTAEIDYTILNTSLASAAGYIAQTLQGQSDKERATTFGAAQRPLGIARLRIVEMVLNIIRLNIHDVSLELANKGVFKSLMDLMVQYEWNNMLHNFVEKILVSTLESEFHDVRDKLLNESDLLGFLAANTQEVDYTMPNAQKRKLRRGYLGQITRIAKLLERLGEVDTDIKEYLNNDKWNKFKEEYLTVTLEKDNKDLAKSAHRESEDFAGDYLEGALGGPNDRNGNEDGTGEDDINDRDDENREGHDFTNNDIFNKFGSQFEEWGQEEQQHGESNAENKDFWSMSPSDFSTTFKFGAFPGVAQDENTEDTNKYLELNRKLEVIDIGPQHDEKLEQAYFDNAFWAKPKDHGHNVDDILKEFEGL